MRLPVVFTDAAREELAEPVEYLGPRTPRALRALLLATEKSLSLIADGYFEGAAVSLTTGEAARRCVVRNLILYYRKTDAAVDVLHVWEGRRSPLQR